MLQHPEHRPIRELLPPCFACLHTVRAGPGRRQGRGGVVCELKGREVLELSLVGKWRCACERLLCRQPSTP
eukprot:5841784-Pleurochrysis_carterae.AAC.2